MTAIVCGDHLRPGAADRLGAVVIREWCMNPEVPEDLEGDSLVVAVCRDAYSLGPLQRALRRAGFDPLGVPVLGMDPEDFDDEVRLGARIVALEARAAVFKKSGPEHVRMVVPTTVSRRSLLTLSVPEYRACPAVDRTTCRADGGCAACVAVCPHGVITWHAGAVEIDRVGCASCGRCVAACPTGAMVNPVFTPAQLHAEVAALIDAVGSTTDRAPGVVFVCARGESPVMTEGWYPVAVPCVGMLPPHWILAPVLMGAAALAVAECTCGVEPDADDRAHEALAFAHVWADDDLVFRLVGHGEAFPAAAPEEVEGLHPFGPRGAAEVASVLGAGGRASRVSGRRSPLGLVTIDPSACTGCEMCVVGCPTGALSSLHPDGKLRIDFEPALCTGCGTCLTRCPEIERRAISVEMAVDPVDLVAGKRTLVVHGMKVCVRCGSDVATVAALDRIVSRLENERLVKTITSLCIDCRGMTMVF